MECELRMMSEKAVDAVHATIIVRSATPEKPLVAWEKANCYIVSNY
jgi:hypothetical protein